MVVMRSLLLLESLQTIVDCCLWIFTITSPFSTSPTSFALLDLSCGEFVGLLDLFGRVLCLVVCFVVGMPLGTCVFWRGESGVGRSGSGLGSVCLEFELCQSALLPSCSSMSHVTSHNMTCS